MIILMVKHCKICKMDQKTEIKISEHRCDECGFWFCDDHVKDHNENHPDHQVRTCIYESKIISEIKKKLKEAKLEMKQA